MFLTPRGSYLPTLLYDGWPYSPCIEETFKAYRKKQDIALNSD